MNQQIATIPTPSDLISQAIDKGLDVEQLGKLMDLQEHYEANLARKAYADAMNRFQAKKPKLVKSSNVNYTTPKGGTTNYNFIPLPQIQKAIDKEASKVGLSYSWKQELLENNIKITCVVTHIDGHSEETWLSAPADNSGGKNTIQGIGSAVSYLKRYTLTNAFGLSSEEDDDGIGSELTKTEIQELQLIQIQDLYIATEKHLSLTEKKRAEEIIKKKETKSYRKMIIHLKRINNDKKV